MKCVRPRLKDVAHAFESLAGGSDAGAAGVVGPLGVAGGLGWEGGGPGDDGGPEGADEGSH